MTPFIWGIHPPHCYQGLLRYYLLPLAQIQTGQLGFSVMLVLLCPDHFLWCWSSRKIQLNGEYVSCIFTLICPFFGGGLDSYLPLSFDPFFCHLPWPFCWFYFVQCWLKLFSKFLGSTVSSPEVFPRVLNLISQDSFLMQINYHLFYSMFCYPWSITLWTQVQTCLLSSRWFV